jgi:hypothetical protein
VLHKHVRRVECCEEESGANGRGKEESGEKPGGGWVGEGKREWLDSMQASVCVGGVSRERCVGGTGVGGREGEEEAGGTVAYEACGSKSAA